LTLRDLGTVLDHEKAVAASGVRSSSVDHARQGPGGIAERDAHRGTVSTARRSQAPSGPR
jgi:hypothetical protein